MYSEPFHRWILFVKLDQLLGLGIIASLNSMSDLGIGGLIAAMFAIVAVLFLYLIE